MPGRHILEAFWETRERGLAILAQDWTDPARPPPLLLNPGGQQPRLLRQLSPFIYGRRAGYFIQGADIEFVFWPPYYPNLDWEDERIYVGGDFNGWNKAVGDANWLLRREIRDGQSYLVLRMPKEKCLGPKATRFKFISGEGRWLELPMEVINRVRDGDYENYVIEPNRTGLHVFYFWSEEPHYLLKRAELVWAEDNEHETCPIINTDYLLSHATDRPLGAQPEADRTVFSLFAPRASSVSLRIYDNPAGQFTLQVDLSRHHDGCWETTLPHNLHGQFYDYHVEGENYDGTRLFNPRVRILDPYALATVGHKGPGIVLDATKLPQAKQCFMPPSWHDLVIVETHVRDLIARAPLKMSPEERRGFKGLAKWLRSPDCYLRQLGVNAVELQPVQEFDNEKPEDYHWGYMPVNYFSPASAYCTDPAHGTQIPEFKDLVDAFHEAGMAVILDVVYNHVGEPNHLFSIDKFYYFTCDHEGHLTNWSGCGNDLRTTTPMARRLVIDSLIHLVRTFDVDGFRFDLADLVGLAMLKEVEVALKAVKPSIILIAEPWSFKGHIGHALRHTGWSSWNDHFREFITQYVCGQGNAEGLRFFLSGSPGSIAMWPAQTVNYTQSHDDRAWEDRITENSGNRGDSPTPTDIRRHHLFAAILFSALGMPMLAQGQDFLHSKQGVNNTYLRGDLNALDYTRLDKFRATHDYFSAWIKFRLSPAGRHFRHDGNPPTGYFESFTVPDTSATGLLYNANSSLGTDQLFFAANPHPHPITLDTGALPAEKFIQLANADMLKPEGLDKTACYKWENGKLELPPLSAGLWRQG
ncbi:MAG TPA: alpha-amylase family glycosyl hydrolase [Opitutales bacterium]|jgi:pullulanase|nr:alpha-amylase family glycosyl hydrolase [Opitutales bacterium]